MSNLARRRRRGLDRKDNNNLMRGCARWRRRARERVHASHTHLAPLARGRKAICRMTNERRATWVASAVAGNGEQRAVSPRALSHSSCLGPESETSETDERHVYRQYDVPSIFSWSAQRAERGPSLRFPLRAWAKREPLQIRARSYIGDQHDRSGRVS